jgi:radical SAM superfamily enzyme YgiQ (UPF0313 family)
MLYIIQNPAPRKGLSMRVLLIAANTEQINMLTLPLGLGLVAAATRRAGHEVTFLDLLTAADPLEAVREQIETAAPEVIGISVRNIDDQSRSDPRMLIDKVREVVAECRRSEAPIVVGGPGFSIFPAEALAYLDADIGVWGEGEEVFPALLERLRRGEDPCTLPGVLKKGDPMPVERASVDLLDEMPLWDNVLSSSLSPTVPDLWIPLQSRRGCPNQCSYCSTEHIQGRRIRTRSPRLVADQVGRLAAAGFRRIYFVDNSFNIPLPHAMELCRELHTIEPKVEWRCILYPEHVDENLVRTMAEAGCKEVALGFESGSPRILREMNKRYTPAEVRGTSDLLQTYGIRRFGFLLLGGPGEDRDSVEESLAFAESLGLDGLRITIGIRIYPGTPLARRAVSEGIIASEEDLLAPSFYLAEGLDPWIYDRIADFHMHS